MNNYYYFIFNKPSKTISTLKFIRGYSTIYNYINTLNYCSLHLIGRLDYYSRGAVLLTNNGFLSYKLVHPTFKILKKYIVKVKGIPSKKSINIVKNTTKGLLIFKNIGITKQRNSWFKIILFSGKNKQIVNICWNLHTPVIKIIRTSFAGIDIANINIGNIRILTYREILNLHMQVKT